MEAAKVLAPWDPKCVTVLSVVLKAKELTRKVHGRAQILAC